MVVFCDGRLVLAEAKPEVMKLSTMKLVYPGVSLKGIKSQDSGLYNPR